MIISGPWRSGKWIGGFVRFVGGGRRAEMWMVDRINRIGRIADLIVERF